MGNRLVIGLIVLQNASGIDTVVLLKDTGGTTWLRLLTTSKGSGFTRDPLRHGKIELPENVGVVLNLDVAQEVSYTIYTTTEAV